MFGWGFALLLLASIGVSESSGQTTPSPTPVPTPTPRPVEISPAVLPDDPPPIAPNFEAAIRPLPSSERVGVDTANQLPISLDKAVEMALQNNNDIEASRNDVRISEFNLRFAEGAYDPNLSSQSFYESATTPTASTIGGATNGSVTVKRIFGTAGVSGFSPYSGGSYSADFTTSRTVTSNTNATLNPQYPTNLTFRYTQPLFRGRRFDNTRRQIEIARKNLGLSDLQFRQRAIEVVALVERAYWDLAYALRNLQVQIDAVKQARTQLESNQRMVAKGALAPINIVSANAQITTFEQNVYMAQEDVTRAENSLKTLILSTRTANEWSQPIIPVSEIGLVAPQVPLELATSEALKNRPEVAQLDQNSEINEVDERYYRDQTKPRVDLVGVYTMQGLAGGETVRSTNVPQNLIGGYFNSLGNLIQQDFPTYQVGVQISLPWGNRAAEANLGRTLVISDRIKNQRSQTEQIIEAEVRNALQALRSAEARLTAAIATRKSAEQMYESEDRLFRAGTSTFYLVLQRQNDLVTARGRELQAQTDLNKAISEFQRATGSTLEANNVKIK
ncbi:MAG: TolC family protein [Pyrinomonadaceae bacterium]